METQQINYTDKTTDILVSSLSPNSIGSILFGKGRGL